MSTTPNLSLQVYAPDGTPIPPTVSREHLLDLARGVYERGGTYLSRGDVDIELAEVADKAACSLLRDRWDDAFPLAAYTELLTAVAALRAVLGFDPSPTAPEVFAWSLALAERIGEGVEEPTERSFVSFADGPYRGAVLSVPASLRAGPKDVLTVPIEWGDSAERGRGEARYQRGAALTDEGLWLYRLDGDVREDARPHIAPAATSQKGATR
ncbi:hypothetical protein ACF08W_28790 [Streptomyces sp. NPDC015144]|uniref:hypothetical protein n=1 Tax=Streptomyces sp. NPDC015144 TaxID=3364944 RepID=UPI00370303C0